jgi:rod shape-determining protein MreC
VQSAADRVFNPVGDLFGGVTRYGSLKTENARLRDQLSQARSESLRQAGAERELENLRALQDLAFAPGMAAVSARVVSTGPSNFQLTVTIDKGSDQKVDKGMPVVTGAGLVGRVVDVSRSRATVTLVTDRSSNVGIRFQSTGSLAIARGAGAGRPLPVDLVDVNTPVAPGEAVVTSGLQDSVFPPDIPVGRVRASKVQAGALSQDVTIDPVVDFTRIEFVKVLLWKGQQ